MSVIDTVTDEIRALVVSGEVPLGHRLAELPLAGRLGVSRPTIREALRRLETRRLLVSDGRGLFVARLSATELRSALLARGSLEALHAGLAAERVRDGEISPAQLRYLAERARLVDQALRAGLLRRAVIDNRAFHQAIDVLAASPVSAALLDDLWDRILTASGRSLLAAGRADAVRAEHRTLVAHINAGRPRRARETAADHVRATLAVVVGEIADG